MNEHNHRYVREGNWRWLFAGEISEWLELTLASINEAGKGSELPKVLHEWALDKDAERSSSKDRLVIFGDPFAEEISRVRLIRRHHGPASSLLCLSIRYAISNDIALSMPDRMKSWWDEHNSPSMCISASDDPAKVIKEEIDKESILQEYQRIKKEFKANDSQS